MSSVVLSGDTSGTVTLTVPAVAGTNTVTVPASTGTVVLANASGQVLTPLQPRFSAKITSNTTNTAGTTVVFPTVSFNIGSAYNSSTGVFTVPVTGYYQPSC